MKGESRRERQRNRGSRAKEMERRLEQPPRAKERVRLLRAGSGGVGTGDVALSADRGLHTLCTMEKAKEKGGGV